MSRALAVIATATVLAACGGADGDSPQACAERGGDWILDGSYYVPGVAIVVNSIVVQTPGRTEYSYSCTVPEVDE